MDDLLRRMEHWANNLESLVEEKTEQLSLEKRRTEELLYQVLPRPVATTLLSGKLISITELFVIFFSLKEKWFNQSSLNASQFTSLISLDSPIFVLNQLLCKLLTL
jgi:hypothetical protein